VHCQLSACRSLRPSHFGKHACSNCQLVQQVKWSKLPLVGAVSYLHFSAPGFDKLAGALAFVRVSEGNPANHGR
jgi:hypothetical protein